MPITYGDFEAQILRNVGNRNDDDTKASILNYTNQTFEELLVAWEWPDLQVIEDVTLTVGKNLYNLNEASLDGSIPGMGISDMYKDYSISLFDSVRWLPPMKRYPYFQWERDIKPVQGFVQGRPGSYTLIGKNQIEFSCPASLPYVIRIYYYRTPGKVVEKAKGIASPLYEMPYDFLGAVLEEMVTAKMWLSLRDKDMAALWAKQAKDKLDDYIKESKQQLNTVPVSRRDRPVIGVPWTDPFVNQMR